MPASYSYHVLFIDEERKKTEIGRPFSVGGCRTLPFLSFLIGKE